MSGYYKIREVSTPAVNGGITSYATTEFTAVVAGVDLIAANTDRKALRIINETDKEMMIATGVKATTPASDTNKILIMPPQTAYTFGSWELPLQALNSIWVGGTPTGKTVVIEGI